MCGHRRAQWAAEARLLTASTEPRREKEVGKGNNEWCHEDDKDADQAEPATKEIKKVATQMAQLSNHVEQARRRTRNN